MKSNTEIKNKQLFSKIKVISNEFRFKIIELTQDKEMSITDLSSILKLAYTKTSDYITMLEKQGLILKAKDGKNVKIKSSVKIFNNQIIFN